MRYSLACIYLLSLLGSFGQSNIVKVSFSDFGLNALYNRRVTMTPVQTNISSPWLVSRESKIALTATNGVAWFTNVLAGAYDLTLASTPPTTYRIGVTNSGTNILVAADLVGVSVDGQNSVVAYTKTQSDGKYALRTNALFYGNDPTLNGVSFTTLYGGTNGSLPAGVITNGQSGVTFRGDFNITNTINGSFFYGSAGDDYVRLDENGNIFSTGSATIGGTISAGGVISGDGSGLTNLTFESANRYFYFSSVTNPFTLVGVSNCTTMIDYAVAAGSTNSTSVDGLVNQYFISRITTNTVTFVDDTPIALSTFVSISGAGSPTVTAHPEIWAYFTNDTQELVATAGDSIYSGTAIQRVNVNMTPSYSTNYPAGTRLLLKWKVTSETLNPTWNFYIGNGWDSHIAVNVGNVSLGGAPAYTNDAGLPGVINGNAIGTNLTGLASDSVGVLADVPQSPFQGTWTNFATPAWFRVANAGTSSANGDYVLAAAANWWTNSSACSLVSNSSSPRWTITNATSGTLYSKAFAATPDNNYVFSVVSGASNAPNVSMGRTLSNLSSNDVIRSGYVFQTPANSNSSVAFVETIGSDEFGMLGLRPFRSLNPLYATNNNSTISNFSGLIKIGYGDFRITNSFQRDGLSLVGEGMKNTRIISDAVRSTTPSKFIPVGHSNHFKDIEIVGVLQTDIDSTSTYTASGLTLDNVSIVGDVDAVLSSGRITNAKFYNSKFSGYWDLVLGVVTGTFVNCEMTSVWTGNTQGSNTNVAAQVFDNTGVTCVRLGHAASDITIIGGVYSISNAPTVGYTGVTNACIKISFPDAKLTLQGPSLNHYSTNESFAIITGGATNINGWYWDNGEYVSVVAGVFTRASNGSGITNLHGTNITAQTIGTNQMSAEAHALYLNSATITGFTTTTNIYFTNGPVQNFTISAAEAFNLVDPTGTDTNLTISVRLNLIGSNTVTWQSKIAGAANLTITNVYSAFLFDWTPTATNWHGYKLR